MVIHHPEDGQTHPQDGLALTVDWSTTIPGMVTTFPRTVTHHYHDGQLDFEFDSSAAQHVYPVPQCYHLS